MSLPFNALWVYCGYKKKRAKLKKTLDYFVITDDIVESDHMVERFFVTEMKDKPKRHRTRLERKSDLTRKTLLEAARTIFAQKGLDLTTIDDITQQADVGKGTFYYHFKNKNGLIRELIKGMLAELREAIDQRCHEEADLERLLDALIRAHIDFFSKRWEDFVLFFQGRADLTLRDGYDGIETPFNDYLEHVAGLMDAVIKYRLGPQTLTRISCAVAGFVSGYYSFAIIASEENEMDEALRPVRSALVAGLVRFINEAIPKSAVQIR